MTVDERLALIQFKIERANEHIINLNIAIKDFFDSKPYQVSTKRDANRRLIYYVSSVKPAPICLAIIAGDAIQNLRSALDHLAWQLFLVGPQRTTTNRQIQRQVSFPIGSDVLGFNSQLGRFRSIFKQDAITTLNIIQPYKLGKGHKIWMLNELNNIDKHRFLVTVASILQSTNIGAYMCAQMNATGASQILGFPVPKLDAYFKTSSNHFPLKEGDELFTDAVDAQVNKWLDFRFNIALNEVGVIDGENLLNALSDFSDIVNKTVLLFKSCLT